MVFCENILKLFLILQLFLIFSFTEQNIAANLMVPEEIVADLYSKYKEAVLDEKLITPSRRLLKPDKHYEIHVKKLKEVNGFKKHNLMIKENLRSGDTNHNNPLIYINNPVESKIPNAYLSLEEFKEILANRIILQRNELTTHKNSKIALKSTTSLENKNKPVNIIKKAVKRIKTSLNTHKAEPSKTTTSKNITVKFKIDVTTKTPVLLQTSKIVITTNNLEETKEKIENGTKEIKSTTSLKPAVSESTTESEDANLTPINYTEPHINQSTNLSIIENTTKLNSFETETEVTKTSGDFRLVSSSNNLLIDLVTNTKKQPNEDANITEKFVSSFKNYEVTKKLNTETRIATSTGVNSKTTSEYTTNVVTEKPTQTMVQVSTVEVTRKTYKPKRTTMQKVSFGTSHKNIKGTPKKRSTLSRPLVFMGS